MMTSRSQLARLIIFVNGLLISSFALALQPSNLESTRRSWLTDIFQHGTGMIVITTQCPQVSEGKNIPIVETTNPLPEILEAQTTLDTLLTNWKRATVDCTFADVPRELLEQKNKELLLEKASTFALFDKSVSVETCKTTNRIVRDYLGVTGKGPLVGLEKKLKRGLEYLGDVDDLENYVAELEAFGQAFSRATSLSYAAGIADVGAVNNFSKEDADNGIADEDPNTNLNQAKAAIQDSKRSLDAIVAMLQK